MLALNRQPLMQEACVCVCAYTNMCACVASFFFFLFVLLLGVNVVKDGEGGVVRNMRKN